MASGIEFTVRHTLGAATTIGWKGSTTVISAGLVSAAAAVVAAIVGLATLIRSVREYVLANISGQTFIATTSIGLCSTTSPSRWRAMRRRSHAAYQSAVKPPSPAIAECGSDQRGAGSLPLAQIVHVAATASTALRVGFADGLAATVGSVAATSKAARTKEQGEV